MKYGSVTCESLGLGLLALIFSCFEHLKKYAIKKHIFEI